jgi:hypothetical protein
MSSATQSAQLSISQSMRKRSAQPSTGSTRPEQEKKVGPQSWSPTVDQSTTTTRMITRRSHSANQPPHPPDTKPAPAPSPAVQPTPTRQARQTSQATRVRNLAAGVIGYAGERINRKRTNTNTGHRETEPDSTPNTENQRTGPRADKEHAQRGATGNRKTGNEPENATTREQQTREMNAPQQNHNSIQADRK